MNLVQQRTQLIREGTPSCAEELFEMQNRICDLCSQPIQDLALAHLDHSTPVVRYAKCLDISTEDAIRECNHPDNLRVAHSSCNRIKANKTRDQWFELGLDKKVGIIEVITDARLARHKFRSGAGGRIGGAKTGPKSQREGWGIFAPGINSIGGKLGGRTNAESGHMSRLGKEHGHQTGIKWGPINGRRNVESGHLAYARHCMHIKKGIINSNCSFCMEK